MDEAGAIEQHVDRPDLARQRRDRLGRAHVEPARLAGKPLEPVEIEIGGDDLGAFGGEGLGGRATNARRRRGQHRNFSCEPAGHRLAPLPAVRPADRPAALAIDQHIGPRGARESAERAATRERIKTRRPRAFARRSAQPTLLDRIALLAMMAGRSRPQSVVTAFSLSMPSTFSAALS